MTMMGKTLVGLTAAALLVAGPAFAGPEVEDELAEMREMVEGLKQRVEAQEEQLQHQGVLLEDAQKVVREVQTEDGTASGMAELWQAIDVNMSVAGSYAWNFNNPTANSNAFATSTAFPGVGRNSGRVGLYPFHGDHNSFQVDQVWFDIGKDVTEESRGGFMFTTLLGNTAAFLGQGSPTFARITQADSATELYVHQAYVSWLVPVLEVEVNAGKFATLVGAEVADATQNWNITRGNVYQLFQPIDHTGVLASREFGPVSIAGAIANSGNLGVGSPDVNKEKIYLAQLGVGQGPVGAAVTLLYGADGVVGAPSYSERAGGNKRDYGLLDVVATLETDVFEAWVNADYAWVEGSRAAAWGIAVAGMVPITDVFSAAVRLEYARDKSSPTAGLGSNGGLAPVPVAPNGWFGFNGVFPGRGSDVYSATGTLAYEVAENLTLKGEVRYDKWNEATNGGFGQAPDAFFANTGNQSRSDQVVALAQLVYGF